MRVCGRRWRRSYRLKAEGGRLHRLPLLASALTASVACAPAFYSVEGVPPLRNLAIVQGCPVAGMPMEQLRALAAVNDMRMEFDSATSRATLHPKHSDLVLQVQMAGDTVADWRAVGVATSALAKPTAIWYRADHRGLRKRVHGHVSGQHLDANRAYAVYRSCVVAGTTPSDLRASWGEPARQVISADTVRLIYGYGVEGQHVEFVFVGDSVVAMREKR